MRKWVSMIVLGICLLFPNFAAAQGQITIRRLDISLWPEYDRADMLVIYHALVNAPSFPVQMDFRIPATATLHTIAIGETLETVTDQGLEYTTRSEGDWFVLTANVAGPAIQLEYYDPQLIKEGSTRTFSYEWTGDYAVEDMTVIFQVPFNATQFTSTLPLQDDGVHLDKMQYYFSKVGAVPAGESFSFQLSYEKNTNALSASRLEVQPVAPVDENTPGRVSLNNTLPYFIGGLGVVMILGGFIYYWQAGRFPSKRPRRRSHSRDESETGDTEHYCPQCGTRAKAGDRFCRTCGARLRHQEG
ncbi:MAG: zinc ribbon domain-containing protein [Chloroflexi bacterium]|nr:zinc ribbon domain-containing protein [Chloroflexota bacterium]